MFGPILPWEMTVTSRRARYFTLRALYAALLLLTLWSTYATVFLTSYRFSNVNSIRLFEHFASVFFTQYTVCQLIAVLVLTPGYLATAITVEKERRTIEYLFATDLRNREIVFGKWAARVLNVLVVVLAGLPILAFSMFFGGVDLGRTLLMTLVSVNCLASTAGLALLVSVYARRTREALSNAYGLLILLLVSPWIYRGLVEAGFAFLRWRHLILPNQDWLYDLLLVPYDVAVWAEPFYVYVQIVQTPAPPSTFLEPILVMTAWHWGLAALCLVVASWRLRPVYLRRAGTASRSQRRQLRGPWTRRPAGEIGERPMFWKEWYFERYSRRSRISCSALLLALLVLYGSVGWMFLERISGNMSQRNLAEALNFLVRIAGTILIGVSYILVAQRAATSVGTERDRGCWDSLLTTTLDSTEIMVAKFASALKPIPGAICLFAPIWLLAVYMEAMSLSALPCVLTAAIAYGIFVAGLGTYQSLKQPRTGRALGITFGICLCLGGLGQMLGTFIFIPFAMLDVHSEILAYFYFLSVPWFVLGFAPFSPQELSQIDDEVFTCVVIACLYLVAAVSIGLGLLSLCIRSFDRFTGRTEAWRTPSGGSPSPGSAVPESA